MKTRSRKQEEAGAKEFGGHRVSGSGNGLIKNDVRSDWLSIEFKYTDAKSFTYKFKELETAERNALLDGLRKMVFIVEGNGKEWVTISKDFFTELIHGHSE